MWDVLEKYLILKFHETILLYVARAKTKRHPRPQLRKQDSRNKVRFAGTTAEKTST